MYSNVIRARVAKPNPKNNVLIEADVIEQFCRAMREQDIRVAATDIQADGKLHRIRAEGDKDKTVWFVLHADDRPAGMFGCNRRYGYDQKFTWKADIERKPLTPEEKRAYRERMARMEAERAAQVAAARGAAAERANRLWNDAVECEEHPYLERKSIRSHGLRVGKWEVIDQDTGEVRVVTNQALLIPMRDIGKRIHSLQAIMPKKRPGASDKLYLTDGDKEGHFWTIGRPLEHDGKQVLVICEGYATGASIHEATGHCVIIAFDAQNLLPVAKVWRARFPDAIIIMAADNDQWTLKPVENPGLRRARECAKAVDALVAFPPFEPQLGATNDQGGRAHGPTDFNDLQVMEGPEVVCGVIDAVLNQVQKAVGDRTPAHDEDDEFTIDHRAPFDIAHQLIMRNWSKDDRRTIHRTGGSFYRWEGTHYDEVSDEGVRATLYRELSKANRLEDGLPFKPDSASISKVEDALRAAAQLPGERPSECWIDGDEMPPAKEIISVSNGLLHLPTRELLPHDPRFFTLNSLPFAYDTDAPEPVEWLKFLEGIWPNDPESIGLLQRWFGYMLSSDTSHQKLMLLIGPPRSGKGTIAATMKTLLGGEANVAGPRLGAFGSNFGLEPLIGKRAAIVGDARLSSRVDQGEIVGSLLGITGEDTLTIDRKNRTAWTGVLPARITICTNELPRLQDASGALASRFLVLKMERSFLGQEDRGLGARVQSELPGILKWALDGWSALQREGRFPSPEASRDSLGALDELVSPVRAFITEMCEVDAAASASCQDVYASWCGWCDRQGRDHPGTLQSFGRDLAAAVAGLKVTQPRNGDGPRRRVYEGIRLRGRDDGIGYTRSFVWNEDDLEFIPVDDGSGFYSCGPGVSFEEHTRLLERAI